MSPEPPATGLRAELERLIDREPVSDWDGWRNFAELRRDLRAVLNRAPVSGDGLRKAAIALIAERRRDVTPQTGHAFWDALDALEAALAAPDSLDVETLRQALEAEWPWHWANDHESTHRGAAEAAEAVIARLRKDEP